MILRCAFGSPWVGVQGCGPCRKCQAEAGEGLQAHYLREFGGSGAGRMLQAVIDAYPNELSRTELSEAASVDANGGSFNTYLSKLRTLELVEGRTSIRASEELFS